MELRVNKNSLDEGYLLHWYEITKVIGRGGFGITYLAHDNNLDRNVAIKEFMPEDFASREDDSTVQPKTGEQRQLYDWGLERFITEARTLAKFNHPNIVRVLSVFEENNTAYMVMEYAQGKDLSKIFKKEPKFTEERLLDTFIPVLDGLSLVHNAGFIHRDIKPANIYICDNNSPLLLDFGSARQSIGSKTKALTSLVTFGYAPYEQYNEGSGKQGPWTDIYSLGASIYFGITGKKPVDALFRGGSFLEKGIDTYEPVSLSEKGGEYSDNFLLAVDKALMFKIDERPKNILAWADMLLGKTQAPQLPDYMLNPPEVDDETELSWSDTELGYNTEISKAANSGTQGLVDAHGKRNTSKTQATVVRSKPAESEPYDEHEDSAYSDKQDSNEPSVKSTLLSFVKLNTKKIAIASVVIVFTTVIFVWMYSDATESENIEVTQKIEQYEIQKKKQEEIIQQQKIEARQAKNEKNRRDYFLRKARQAGSLEKYASPADDNAFYYYQQVLKIDKNNQAAKEGIATVETSLSRLANVAFENNQLNKSELYLDQLVIVNPESLDAKYLKQQIDNRRSQDKEIETWLSEARGHYKSKRYTSPENKNAYSVYRKILEKQVDNSEALTGIKNIQRYYIGLFDRNIKSSKFKKAQQDISVMKKIAVSDSNIKSMQNRLNEAKNKTKISKVSKPKKIIIKKLTIEQASSVIGQFKAALQTRNTTKIKRMSQFAAGRSQFLDQLHSQYRTINVKVLNFNLIPKDNRAHAEIQLSDLIDINGNKVSPGGWSKFKITIGYNKRNTLKVYW